MEERESQITSRYEPPPRHQSVSQLCRGHTCAAGVLGPYRVEVPAACWLRGRRPAVAPPRRPGRPPSVRPARTESTHTIHNQPPARHMAFHGDILHNHRDFNVFLCETVRARARPTYGQRAEPRTRKARSHSQRRGPARGPRADPRGMGPGGLPVLPRCIPAVLPPRAGRAPVPRALATGKN